MGLLSQPETEQPMEQPMEQGQEKPMDPKTQEDFDMFVANGMNIIYSKKFGERIVSTVLKSETPIDEISRFTLMIVNRIETALDSKKVKLADGAKVQGANQLMGEIMTMAEKAGLPPLSEDQRGECWSMAVSQYIDSALKSGRMTPEQIQEMSAQAQQTPEGQEIMAKMQPQEQQAQPIPQQGQPMGQPQGGM